MEGWVKLHRKSLDNGWLSNPNLWAFWCYCLIRANHSHSVCKVGYQDISLAPGQFIFGRDTASKQLKMSVRTIRTCLDYLSKSQNVTIKTTNKFSIISIVKWDTYQTQELPNDQQNDQPPTNKRPATDQPPTTDKNEENELNGKNGKDNKGSKEPLSPEASDDAVQRVPLKEISRLYHSILHMLPKTEMPENMKRNIRARYKNGMGNIDAWERYFCKVADSPFLTGKNKNGWTASLGWLANPTNMDKVQGGAYDLKGGPIFSQKEQNGISASMEFLRRHEDD